MTEQTCDAAPTTAHDGASASTPNSTVNSKASRYTAEEANNPWAEYLKLVDGKSRGLPSEDEPVDEREWEEFERKYRGGAGLPTDGL